METMLCLLSPALPLLGQDGHVSPSRTKARPGMEASIKNASGSVGPSPVFTAVPGTHLEHRRSSLNTHLYARKREKREGERIKEGNATFTMNLFSVSRPG